MNNSSSLRKECTLVAVFILHGPPSLSKTEVLPRFIDNLLSINFGVLQRRRLETPFPFPLHYVIFRKFVVFFLRFLYFSERFRSVPCVFESFESLPCMSFSPFTIALMCTTTFSFDFFFLFGCFFQSV